jgi:2-keto-4-pentenoate hydratase
MRTKDVAPSLNPNQWQAVDVLFDCARTGVLRAAALPAGLSLEEGLGAQLGMLDRWREAGEELGGWKVGLTSGAGRDSMGQGFRPFGYILGSRILPSGFRLPSATCPVDQLEVELCLELGSRLRGANLALAQVSGAIAGVRAAFELNHKRMPRPVDPGIQIADDLSQWGIAVGELVSWPADLSELTLTVECDGIRVATVGPDFDMDDPLVAVSRVCTTLDRFGLGLEPGQQVITGALFKSPVKGPAEWRAELAGVGVVAGAFV